MTEHNGQLPHSQKVYLSGEIHPDLRVPFREITLAPTKSTTGEIEVNKPVCVYDTSGPWGDPKFDGDVTRGLPPLRAKWIRDRGDVEEIEGRRVKAIDDGFLSEKHAALQNRKRRTPNVQRPTSNGDSLSAARKPLRARTACTVTQLAYARSGIITPEMEFIAIRENIGREIMGSAGASPNGYDSAQSDLSFRHRGSEPIGSCKSTI